MATIAAFLVLSGGTAVALSGFYTAASDGKKAVRSFACTGGRSRFNV
jgi:hypothetical protein